MKGDTEGDTYMLFSLEGVWYTMYICTMNSEVQRQTGLLPTLSRLRLFLLTSHIFTIGLEFHTLLCQSLSPLLSLNHLSKQWRSVKKHEKERKRSRWGRSQEQHSWVERMSPRLLLVTDGHLAAVTSFYSEADTFVTPQLFEPFQSHTMHREREKVRHNLQFTCRSSVQWALHL